MGIRWCSSITQTLGVFSRIRPWSWIKLMDDLGLTVGSGYQDDQPVANGNRRELGLERRGHTPVSFVAGGGYPTGSKAQNSLGGALKSELRMGDKRTAGRPVDDLRPSEFDVAGAGPLAYCSFDLI